MIDFNIDKYNINENMPLVVGVSTGPDSMALLHLLQKTKYKIICTHINHGVRKESAEEEKYLNEYCKKNNIIFEHYKIEDYKEKNFENEARKYRFLFFEKILEKYKSKYLFLAHHGDDLIETILMKITRGSNIEGYEGFKEISTNYNQNNEKYYIIRPLIKYTKKELINYNNINKIKYYTDITNKENICTRNRYRNQILPILKLEDPQIHKKFLKFSETLQEYDNYIKFISANIIDSIYKNSTLNLTEFKKLELFIQKNILFIILQKLYQNKANIIKENHINNIINIINNSKPNLEIKLPQNLTITKEYEKLIFNKNKQYQDSYIIKLQKENNIKNKIIRIVNSEETDGNDVFRLNSHDIALPLYIRNRKKGDYIELYGTNGKKKIKEIFIEAKIPIEERNNYPLVVDANDNILWIPNLKKSKFNSKKHEIYDIILKCNERKRNNEQQN